MLEMLSNLRCVFLLVFCALFAIYCIIRAVKYSSWKFGLITSSISLLVFLIFYPIIGCMKCGTGYYLVRTFYRCPVLNAPPSKAEKAKEKEKQFLIEYQPVHPAELKKGNVVKIGEWGPDGKGFPIEWLVISENNDGTYTLLSKEILKLGFYKKENGTGQAPSTLKDWLENDFYNKAFTANEQKFIENKPALLSVKEAIVYGNLKASGAIYAGDNAAWGQNKSWWWLAETGNDSYHAKYVDADGKINNSGKKTDTENGGIRPYITYRPYKTIELGKYPYDAEKDEDRKPIKWAILDEDKDGTLTLMAMNGVAVKPFHNEKTLAAWSDSDLRKWMNGDFLEKYFSYAEREALIPYSHKVLHYYTDKAYIPYENMLSLYIECIDSKFKGGYGTSENGKYGGWLIPDDFQILKPGYFLMFSEEGKIVKGGVEAETPIPVIPVVHFNPEKYKVSLAIEKEMAAKRKEEEELERQRIEQERQAEEDRIKAKNEKQAIALSAKYRTGDIVTLGYYPYYKSGKKKLLEWRILQKYSDGTALMITRHSIDTVKYNESKFAVNWLHSSINKWLNNEFYNTAFSEQEKAAVQPAPDTLAKEAQASGAINNVADYDSINNKVFLLSAREAELYFKEDWQRSAYITAYAKDKMRTPESMSWWWLRSSNAVYIAPGVTSDGVINTSGLYVNTPGVGVRPVIMFNIKDYLIFSSPKTRTLNKLKVEEKKPEKPSKTKTDVAYAEQQQPVQQTFYQPPMRTERSSSWSLWEIIKTLFRWCMWGVAILCVLSIFSGEIGVFIIGIILIICLKSCG